MAQRVIYYPTRYATLEVSIDDYYDVITVQFVQRSTYNKHNTDSLKYIFIRHSSFEYNI